MVPTAVVLAPGAEVAGYRIIEVVGFGGTAVVYRAVQLSLGREVALKVLQHGASSDEEFRERFRREGKILAALEHPNIVPVHDLGELDGQLFLAMRLVRGSSLAERLRLASLSPSAAVTVLTPIADALDTAHAAGVIHRDVKPQNILIDEGNCPYLADFGIARDMSGAALTAGSEFIGSFPYAAPEQFKSLEVSRATDVYALTAVAFECLTGQVPFARASEAGMVQAHLLDPPPRVDQRQPEAEHFNAVIARGMAKDPSERFATATELIREIAALSDELPVERRTRGTAFTVTPDVDRAMTAETVASSGPAGAPRVPAPEPSRAAAADRSSGSGPASLRSGRARRLPRMAAVAICVAAAGATVFAVAGEPAAARRFRASAPPFVVSYSGPWHRVSRPDADAAYLAAQLGEEPGSSGNSRLGSVLADDGTSLAAGWLTTSAATPAGVPPALVAHYGRRFKVTDVSIDHVLGKSYAWTGRARTVDAFVLATPKGDAAIICVAVAGTEVRLPSCQAIAKGSRISATTIPPGDPAVATELAAPFGRISQLWSATSIAAGSLASRARATRSLAAALGRPETQLAKERLPARYTRPLNQVERSLTDEVRALDALASEAKADRRRAYSASATTLATDERRLRRAVAGFAAYGVALSLPSVARITLPRPATEHSSTTDNQTSSVRSNGSGPTQYRPQPPVTTPEESTSPGQANTQTSTVQSQTHTSTGAPQTHTSTGAPQTHTSTGAPQTPPPTTTQQVTTRQTNAT